jgi:hypothetical protein
MTTNQAMNEGSGFHLPGRGSPIRLAIVGTPRCGNTWLRRLIADACGIAEFAEHRIEDFSWDRVPDEFILQIHATPGVEVRERFARSGIRPIAIARHPLDVLISILQFAPRERETARWLDGEGGDESSIIGAAPTDKAFLRYAVGPRADALLSLTPAWWREPDCLRVRFERMIDGRDNAAAEILKHVGAAADRIPDVLRRHTFSAERAAVGAAHMWQGRPGLWRWLLPADAARPIAAHHEEVLRVLSYECDPEPSLTTTVAGAPWQDLKAGHAGNDPDEDTRRRADQSTGGS